MAVPYTFGTATSAIPLSQLDTNFATAITLGSTALTLGTTTTSVAGLTLTSPTFTTPALGTPASGTLTNCTGYPGSAISGTISLTTQVTGVLPAANGGTGVANSSTITLGGNFTTSGAFATTLTVTGATNVTLPTTGTLVNTAVTTLSSLASVGTITTGTWNGSIIGSAYGGTGVNNGTSTITLGGNLTTSGAFATTLTVTGLTNVTLPTSGTLVNTAVTTLSSLASIGTITTGTWNGSVIGATYGGTGVNNGSSTITLGGSFTTSGAFATTLTVTGATNVTLPTTGTLSTLAGSETLTNKTLTNPTVTNYVETLYAPAAGSAFTISLANGTIQEISLNANGTITLPSSVAGKSYTIIVTYSGAYTLTWAGGGTLKWAGGTAPTATSVSGKYDIFNFYCDGTNTYGSTFGLNY